MQINQSVLLSPVDIFKITMKKADLYKIRVSRWYIRARTALILVFGFVEKSLSVLERQLFEKSVPKTSF